MSAWELLLKAKWLLDHDDNLDSIYEFVEDVGGNKVPKVNRSGNSISHGASALARSDPPVLSRNDPPGV